MAYLKPGEQGILIMIILSISLILARILHLIFETFNTKKQKLSQHGLEIVLPSEKAYKAALRKRRTGYRERKQESSEPIT